MGKAQTAHDERLAELESHIAAAKTTAYSFDPQITALENLIADLLAQKEAASVQLEALKQHRQVAGQELHRAENALRQFLMKAARG